MCKMQNKNQKARTWSGTNFCISSNISGVMPIIFFFVAEDLDVSF